MGFSSRTVGVFGFALGTSLSLACGDNAKTQATPSAAASALVAGPSAGATSRTRRAISNRGSAVALDIDGAHEIVADEDHEVLFVVPATFDDPSAVKVVALPGPPAQVVALDGVVLVTVRTLPNDASREARRAIHGDSPDAAQRKILAMEARHSDGTPGRVGSKKSKDPKKPPAPPVERAPVEKHVQAPSLDPTLVRQSQGGLLLAMRPDTDKGLVEVGRVVLAPDAWGIAVTSDQKRAVVTSAWSAEAAVVDVGDPAAMKVIARFSTAREPRGVVISQDDKTAFISHLVGAPLSKIDDLTGTPHLTVQPLPTAPARTPFNAELHATLGYALVIAPDGKTLYAPRHAVGADGIGSWWGAPTVDTMDIATGKPLQPLHIAGSPAHQIQANWIMPSADWDAQPGAAPAPDGRLVQPRDVVYRKKSDTLFVASEGASFVTELDALAPDPAMFPQRVFELGQHYDVFGHYVDAGGAPSGIALSADENTLYVYCRSTFDLVRIDLKDQGESALSMLRLADDGLTPEAARGRRLFYQSGTQELSGGLGCAACHPDGRDDGYTWRQGVIPTFGNTTARFVARREILKASFPGQAEVDPKTIKLYPRQTPMIAGRLRSNGPYGWHGENKGIDDRIAEGTHLHRGSWEGSGLELSTGQDVRALDYLVEFLRSGLVPPPTLARDLNDQEKRGKALFEDNKVGCTSCHDNSRELTNRSIAQLAPLSTRMGFEPEEDHGFKTPSLWFIGGTAPYFHDGSAATLDDLIHNNGSRMGNTAALGVADQDALIAYLKTL